MERTEFSREATRLDREFQYLKERCPVNMCAGTKINTHYFLRLIPRFLSTECKIVHPRDIW